MLESLKEEIARNGDKAAFIPIHRLQDIRQDVDNLKATGELNNFQQFIVDHIYQLDLSEADFKVSSILLVASPSPSVINLNFTWEGKRLQTALPASYADKSRSPRRIEAYLKEFLNPRGYHLRYAPQLPHKLLAVRSGLGRYGRNNICFVEGMGSFMNLNPFLSDFSETEDTWQDIRQMDLCHTCQACLKNCPTGAILPDRFLIDNQRCLTYFNESGGEWNFPDWIDPAVHHTLYGCLRCQAICPMNQQHLSAAAEPVEFSEEETAFLMERKPLDSFPEELRQKVEALDMAGYLSGIPRNLQALFSQGV